MINIIGSMMIIQMKDKLKLIIDSVNSYEIDMRERHLFVETIMRRHDMIMLKRIRHSGGLTKIMKPLIYYDFKECKDNKDSIVISKDRLNEIFDEIYQAGYSDGYSHSNKQYITTTPWTTLRSSTGESNVSEFIPK